MEGVALAEPLPTVYLSGAMTGKPQMNFPLFNKWAAELRKLGYTVVNPVELNPDPKADWFKCMRDDIRALCDCDVICLLPGWEESSGAHLELHIAHRLGIKVTTANNLMAGHWGF